MEEKHLDYIAKKLNISSEKIAIKRISKMPLPATYVTWSLGWQGESKFRYEISFIKNKNRPLLYCQISTFLNLITIRVLFFEAEKTKMKIVNI